MIRSLFIALGKLAMLAAAAAFIAGASLFILGAFLTTFPILRMSPRDRRIRAVMEMVGAGAALASTFSRGPVDE
jgi:hypothetical protein